MGLNRRSMRTLAARDFRQVWPLVVVYCAIVGGALGLAVSGEGSAGETLSGAFVAPGILALLAVVPFVQTIVWKEKAAGTFLFLRMLPLTDREILGSKLAVVIAASTLILALPAAGLLAVTAWTGGTQPPLAGWVLLWEWAMVLVMAGWSTAAAIVFTQQWAAIVPYLLLGLVASPLIVGTYLVGPPFWDALLRWRAQQWGLAIAFGLAWHAWKLSLRLFRNRDFAQLVE